ncbi:MAG: methyl-accepting chemotaxis protein [Sphingomonas sp.]
MGIVLPRFGLGVRRAAEGIALQLRRLLWALLGIQAVLTMTLMVGAVTTSNRVGALVTNRIYPIAELQRVSDGYTMVAAVTYKALSGNVTIDGAIATVAIARAQIRKNWDQFRVHPVDGDNAALLGRIEKARIEANATVDEVEMLLRHKQTDRLEFMVSGPLYAGIDPMTIASDSLIDKLRTDAFNEQQALKSVLFRAFVIVALITLFTAAIGVWGARFVVYRVTDPLAAIAEATKTIADERDHSLIPGLERSDEIGAIARALAFARGRSIEARRLSEEARVAQEALHRRQVNEHAAKARRAADLEALFGQFEREAGVVVQQLNSAGPRLLGSAGAMSGVASETEQHALATAALVEQSAGNARTIASSSIELAMAIDSVSEAAQISQTRVGGVHRRTTEGRAQAESLDTLVNEIASVLDLITGLAGQTNLLSLNATIEAARAGPAGRGFAVVAEEVKGLARQTQLAAGKIEARLGAVRTATGTMIDTILSVDALVEGLDEATATTADAVERQRDMTRRIATAISEVDVGTTNAAANMQQLRAHAERSRGTASDLALIADDVAGSVERLRTQVDRLIVDARAV